MKLSVRHLNWRDGRPRWVPSPRIRSAFRARDLKDNAGQWLGMQAAMIEAERINAEVDAWRADGKPRRRELPPAESAHSARKAWLAFAGDSARNIAPSIYWQQLSAATQKGYRKHAAIFLASPFGDAPVRAITKPQLIAWYETLIAARSHAMANAILSTVSVILSHAERLGWRPENSNPAFHMARPGLAPRTVIITPSEIARLVAVADRIDLPEVGDAIVLALHTGQRESDVLALTAPTIVNGRARFALAQNKTAARVSVPLSAALQDRLTIIQKRARAGVVVGLHASGPLVQRADGVAYTDRDLSAFNRQFREVRRRAAAGDDARGEKPMPALLDKKFLDLRDTAVTRLALAECTLAEIRSITGHSLKTITSVLAHYLVLDEVMADAAIAKLQAWMEREGVAV